MKMIQSHLFEVVFLLFCLKALIDPNFATTLALFGLLGFISFQNLSKKEQHIKHDTLEKRIDEMATKINALSVGRVLQRGGNESQIQTKRNP